MSLPLPTELYSSIIEQIPPESLQQSILSLTRALPYAPIPLHGLFEHITLSRPEQAIHLTAVCSNRRRRCFSLCPRTFFAQ
ncbi:hypothetical protein B0H13DRAFT_100133 [Mycena leptocephala]|nr:hypothetical protein B0H13DRAFT_100133 [Mycena leptocephala]